MPRNLDLTAIRSFVAVADVGGVTRAAGFLNLTQSAVSMQLKRLEESLDVDLLDRSTRRTVPTPAGEKLLTYARKMLALNDDILSSLTEQAFEGTLTLGVPHDIVYPEIPKVLQLFALELPKVKVQLVSSFTRDLRRQFNRGDCDIVLTTEAEPDAGAETLSTRQLIWVGAPGGSSWRQRPLQLAFENNCLFRGLVLDVLDDSEIPWELAVNSNNTRTIEATVSADLAIHALVEGAEPPYVERIAHAGALPDLPDTKINMYVQDIGNAKPVDMMATLLRNAYKRS